MLLCFRLFVVKIRQSLLNDALDVRVMVDGVTDVLIQCFEVNRKCDEKRRKKLRIPVVAQIFVPLWHLQGEDQALLHTWCGIIGIFAKLLG